MSGIEGSVVKLARLLLTVLTLLTTLLVAVLASRVRPAARLLMAPAVLAATLLVVAASCDVTRRDTEALTKSSSRDSTENVLRQQKEMRQQQRRRQHRVGKVVRWPLGESAAAAAHLLRAVCKHTRTTRGATRT